MGTHSESLSVCCPTFFLFLLSLKLWERSADGLLHVRIDDTCVQPGYWNAVADFVASLKSRTPKPPLPGVSPRQTTSESVEASSGGKAKTS